MSLWCWLDFLPSSSSGLGSSRRGFVCGLSVLSTGFSRMCNAMKRVKTMSQSTRGSATVLVFCGTIGVITVAASVAWDHGNLVPKSARPAGNSVITPDIATEEYGKRLIAQTTELLGPDV